MRRSIPLPASQDHDVIAATHARVPRVTHRACGSIALAVVLLLASGCTSVKVHLGMKVYLAKLPVSSIAVSLPNGPGIAPAKSLR